MSLLDTFGHNGVPTLSSYHRTALIGVGLALATAGLARWLVGRAGVVPARMEALDPRWEVEEGMVASASLEMFEPDRAESPAGSAPGEARDTGKLGERETERG